MSDADLKERDSKRQQPRRNLDEDTYSKSDEI
jgi:hypothetical protein